MPEGNHIFISYAGKDTEIALNIIDGLEKEGYNAWYFERDSLDLLGEDWMSLIANKVMGCNAFILLISPNSIVSDMVDKEVNYAVKGKKKILPLLYNITQDEFGREKTKWDFLFAGLNITEIKSSNVAPKLLLIIDWLKRIGIQPISRQTDEIKPKEEKVDKKEDVSAEKKDFETDKIEEKAKEDKIKLEVITPSKTPELPKEIIGKDGAPMVLIPAGEFEMGSNDGKDDEKPVHTVYLDAFYIDKYEVTNAQYKKFVKEKGYKEPEGYWYIDGEWKKGFKPWQDKNFNGDNQPVVCVSWEDAKVYAEWAGERLPTEAEWEKAARGGLVGKKYVWGDEFPPPKGAGNFADKTTKKAFPDWPIIDGYDDGYAYTSPVGSFSSNGYGLYDMAGNVWEWCNDWYDSKYYANSPRENPAGPSSGSFHVCRGGSWSDLGALSLRVSNRNDSNNGFNDIGFRCVR